MKYNSVAFSNLRAEMARNGITISKIAKIIGVTRDTMGKKLSQKSPINLDEAFAIQKEFFPDSDVSYLFAELIQDEGRCVQNT